MSATSDPLAVGTRIAPRPGRDPHNDCIAQFDADPIASPHDSSA
jgi:hypothetical protein